MPTCADDRARTVRHAVPPIVEIWTVERASGEAPLPIACRNAKHVAITDLERCRAARLSLPRRPAIRGQVEHLRTEQIADGRSGEPHVRHARGWSSRRPRRRPTTGGRIPTQLRPPSLVRTNDVHGRLEHGAVPSAQPWSSLTNVRSCTVKPAGTGSTHWYRGARWRRRSRGGRVRGCGSARSDGRSAPIRSGGPATLAESAPSVARARSGAGRAQCRPPCRRRQETPRRRRSPTATMPAGLRSTGACVRGIQRAHAHGSGAGALPPPSCDSSRRSRASRSSGIAISELRGGKRRPHGRQTSADQAAGRTRAASHCSSDLPVGQIVEVPQDEGCPLPLRQLPDQPPIWSRSPAACVMSPPAPRSSRRARRTHAPTSTGRCSDRC